jgi:hypothetical protein
MDDEENPFPKEEAPPHLYEIPDPDYEISYFVFSHTAIPEKERWPYVAKFLGSRTHNFGEEKKRNLPPRVWLIIQPDGSVKPRHLVSQRQSAKKRISRIR